MLDIALVTYLSISFRNNPKIRISCKDNRSMIHTLKTFSYNIKNPVDNLEIGHRGYFVSIG